MFCNISWWRSALGLLFLVAAFSFTEIGLSSEAKADEYWDFFKITCSPQLDYFSLQTMSIPREGVKLFGPKTFKDADDQWKSIFKNLESKYSLYTPKKISTEPYLCELDGRKVEVDVNDGSSKDGRGECGGMGRFTITIRIDGEEKDSFTAYGMNRCLNPSTHLISLMGMHFQDCTLPDPLSSKASAICKQSRE